MPVRRFPPPWSIEEHREFFVVKDATGLPVGDTSASEKSGHRADIGNWSFVTLRVS